jgi:hypothetical protein
MAGKIKSIILLTINNNNNITIRFKVKRELLHEIIIITIDWEQLLEVSILQSVNPLIIKSSITTS